MSEKIRISEYKGFELWDTPAPEGWRVHQYPVQVTCNGVLVNNFANAHDAMKVIDGMDADTIAYHVGRAATEQPATAPDGGGEARSLPQRYRDEREAAQERGETIRDYTSWLEYQVELGEFYQQVQAERGNDYEADNATLRAQLASAEATAAGLREALGDAESTLYAIGARLPMTDSYRSVNINRQELRTMAQDYFKRNPASEQQAADAKPAGGA